MYYQSSLKVERENISYHRHSLTMNYQRSLKVERENIIPSLFTDDELSTFTEDSKKITNTNVHCRYTTNVH